MFRPSSVVLPLGIAVLLALLLQPVGGSALHWAAGLMLFAVLAWTLRRWDLTRDRPSERRATATHAPCEPIPSRTAGPIAETTSAPAPGVAPGPGAAPARAPSDAPAPSDGRTPPPGSAPSHGGSTATTTGGDGARSSAVGRRGLHGSRAGWQRRQQLEAALAGVATDLRSAPAWWTSGGEHALEEAVDPRGLFDELAEFHRGVRVIHDVAVPGTASTIDHLLIGPAGVVVADTQDCPGRVRTDGVHLRVRSHDRSQLIDVALWQTEVVRASLDGRGLAGVPVQGALHWVNLDGLGDQAICLRGIPLLSAGAIVGLAAAGRVLSPTSVDRIVDGLAGAFART